MLENSFVEKDGVRTQRLTFIAALFDDSSICAAGKETEILFALTEATFTQISENGLNLSITLQAPASTYHLRGVAQDAVDGKLVCPTISVEIR
jgi:hypothetical protein